ncbi:MAG: class I SAM-dependent methyltransferase [Sandaracinus sp.]|nr:class I SAM-dependent methyltransferase [Sandaracinus sp.]
MTPPDADPLELYRWAVQDPETHAAVLQVMYETLHDGREAHVLREDFAGTCADSVAWIVMGDERHAIAVDRDAATLAWAKRRAEPLLGDELDHLELHAADVMDVAPPRVRPADILSVLNFSVGYFHTRPALVRYLRHARSGLAEGGILVLNTLGGPGAQSPLVDRRRVEPTPRMEDEVAIPPFDYLWEHRSYDAVSDVLDCRIHFELDAPKDEEPHVLRDAFCYRFRLWGLAELREALLESGFSDAQVWRHTYDPALGDDGVFLGPVDALPDLGQWTAYVVAQV